MSKRRDKAQFLQHKRFAEHRDLRLAMIERPTPTWSAQYWKELSRLAADLENIVFSRPALRWNRHAESRYRREVRSRVKTAWERYLRLK